MWRHVPEEWKPRLRAYLEARGKGGRDRLLASDFPSRQSLEIHFEDGSFARFRYAFALQDEAGRTVMVFTEHCGYHVFPLGTGRVEVVED